MKNKTIAKETLEILEKGEYKNNEGKTINISDLVKNCKQKTKFYSSEDLEKIRNQEFERKFETEFVFVNEKTISTLIELHKTEDLSKAMCLNFASAKNPGGGFLNGAEAQEESIARASALYISQLEKFQFYENHRKMKSCVYTDSMIYSAEVPVFRNDKGELLQEVFVCNFITSPAVNAGVVKRFEPEIENKIKGFMDERMDKMLALSYLEGNETLILGAWGCGVFRNEPEMIAKLFREKLLGKYKNVFKKVVFAVFTKNQEFFDKFVF